MNSSYSALLSATCILVFSRIALALSLDVKNCVVPQNFTIELTRNKRAIFPAADLTVIMDFGATTLTGYEGTNSFNINARNVNVSFSGIVYFDYDEFVVPFLSGSQVFSRRYTDLKVLGLAHRDNMNSSGTEQWIDDCRIILLSNDMNGPGMSGKIANEIHRLAEGCIEPDLCEIVNEMKPQIRSKLPDDTESDLLSTCPEPLVIAPEGCEEIFDDDIVQPIANKAVDVGLEEISERLRAMNGGTFPIPDLDKEFSTGSSIFKVDGYFKATNGTFRDLTTIRRLSDVSLSHNAMKVIAACEFGLDIADLRYPNYELKYGFIRVQGTMSGKVNNTALMMRVAIDYNHKPCRISMEYLRITKFGNMDIQLTGLSPLNWLSTKLLNWITMSWRDQIVVKMEQEFMESVEKQLSSFDCEKYRP